MGQSVIFVRGLPGAGKSSMAKGLYPGVPMLEADDYFMVDGQYRYSPFQVRDAHRDCIRRMEEHIAAGKDVIVCNTFCRAWELKEYMSVALKYPVAVRVLRVSGDFGSSHHVSKEKMAVFRKNFEDFEGEQHLA